MRKIRYKEPTDSLTKMSAPDVNSSNRSSVGMNKFVGEYFYLSLDKLIPFKNQARTYFDEDELKQLAETIKEHGVRQPLSVVKSEDFEGKYEVVSGERRLRASKLAGLEKVPCIILESAAQKDEIALIENVQRADLHPIELARGLKKLIDTYGWGGQTEIERKLGIPQSRISESLKLLTLPSSIQDLAIEKNYTGRDNLLVLLKVESEEEQRKRILGVPNVHKKEKASFSVLRISYAEKKIKIQKNAFKKLTFEQKQEVRAELEALIDELRKV
jgi:ParB family chromosome partitioning protein